ELEAARAHRVIERGSVAGERVGGGVVARAQGDVDVVTAHGDGHDHAVGAVVEDEVDVAGVTGQIGRLGEARGAGRVGRGGARWRGDRGRGRGRRGEQRRIDRGVGGGRGGGGIGVGVGGELGVAAAGAVVADLADQVVHRLLERGERGGGGGIGGRGERGGGIS